MKKTEIMQLVIAGRAHESFEHTVAGMFDVTLMRNFAKANCAPLLVKLDQLLPFLAENRIWEQERVDALQPHEWMEDPILAVELITPTGPEHLFIDGIHRILRRQQEGRKDVQVYMLRECDIIRPDYSIMCNSKDLGMDWGADLQSIANRGTPCA